MYRLFRSITACAALLGGLALGSPAAATPSFGTPAVFDAVPTFHSIGLYWAPAGGGAAATVEFKEAGALNWRAGLDLWYDSRNSEYRGSIVELKPGTAYDIRLTLGGSPSSFQAATWSENPPVPPANVINAAPLIVPNGQGVPQLYLNNSASGTATAWKVYTAAPGQNVIDHTGHSTIHGSASCIMLDGVHHVIIRGFKLLNCRRQGIDLRNGVSDVIIEDNEITGWGNPPYNVESAVLCSNNGAASRRIVIQRNNIHDPRGGAFAWDPGNNHPRGPQAVYFASCGANHVIRYNDVWSTAGHYYNDGIGGAENFGENGSHGFPWADSDIYGNRVSHVYDDAIEAEGDNRNVRIWSNYIDQAYIAIANAATAIGPLYVWRNVSNHMANLRCPTCDPDVEARGEFIKAGSHTSGSYNGGRAYYFHNTMLQPVLAGQSFKGGGGTGIYGIVTGHQLYNFHSLNNIWQGHNPTENDYASIQIVSTPAALYPTIIANHDLYNGFLQPATWPAEAQGVFGEPTHAGLTLPSAANGWSGDFSLATSSPGYQAGTYIPNFNDQTNPDPGAHQSGRPPMTFGSNACFPYPSSCRP